jgi:hypothetical protein
VAICDESVRLQEESSVEPEHLTAVSSCDHWCNRAGFDARLDHSTENPSARPFISENLRMPRAHHPNCHHLVTSPETTISIAPFPIALEPPHNGCCPTIRLRLLSLLS